MGFPIYDFRKDIRNVLVTPQIRARFLRMEPGQVANLHSHDLGVEVFLILEGKAEFEIDGETEVIGPGQMCVALADQMHIVSVVGDRPMTMYLSVTPHIQPTHTGRTPEGDRLPLKFSPSRSYDEKPDPDIPPEKLVHRQVEAAREVAKAARTSSRIHLAVRDKLKAAFVDGDRDILHEVRGEIWGAIFETFERVNELASTWNQLAARTVETEQVR